MGLQSSTQKGAFVQLFQCPQEQLIDKLQDFLSVEFTQQKYLEIVYPPDVRTVLQQYPEKVQLILEYIHNFLYVPQDRIKKQIKYQYKNCLRLLISIVPIMYEKEFYDLMVNLFWATKIPNANEEAQPTDPPFLISLLKKITQLAFTVDFTISQEPPQKEVMNEAILNIFSSFYEKEFKGYVIQRQLLWRGFQQLYKYPNDDPEFYENRYLVLCTIIAICSRTLFNESFSEQVQIIYDEAIPQDQNQQLEKVEKKEESDNEQNQKLVNYDTQIPNIPLLVLQKLPYFPELLLSLLATSLYQSEKSLYFMKNIVNAKHPYQEILAKKSLDLASMILFGQTLILGLEAIYKDQDKPENYCAYEHFKLNNVNFPTILALPGDIKKILVEQIVNQIMRDYRSKQSLLRELPNNHVNSPRQLMNLLSYLTIKSPPHLADLAVAYIFLSLDTNVNQEMALYQLLNLSYYGYLAMWLKSQCQSLLTFENHPVVQGSWADFLVCSFCERIIQLIDKVKDPQFLQMAATIQNFSPLFGPLQDQSASRLSSIILKLSNLDVLLKHPYLYILFCHISNVFYHVISENADSQYMIEQLIRIAPFITMFNTLNITKPKLHLCWQKIIGVVDVDRSFQKQRPASIAEDVKESQLKQDSEIKKKSVQQSQIFHEKDSLCAQVDQQENDPMALYFDTWANFDYKLVREKSGIPELSEFIVFLTEEMKNFQDLTAREQVQKIIAKHDIKMVIKKKKIEKEPINLIEGFELFTKQLWRDISAQDYPYFEKSQLASFVKS
ncbi:hypothetical protein pb186bvf_012362 [Paramecium bursaria]